ncbi:MAG: pyridoxal phosphate-dependent aminotransferase [bacterium]|nr:pyridoxal phosphate-dependent aminotransferase [bacterium]
MSDTFIDKQLVDSKIADHGLEDLSRASIGEMRYLIDSIEKESGSKFIRMEMGIPGIKPPRVAIDAEIEALEKGAAGIYPDFQGIPALKQEAARFAKLFLDIDVSAGGCVPTVGAINGSYAAFMTAGRRDPRKDTVLFIDPGFSMQKQCVKMLGLKEQSFDVYLSRGDKLKDKLESYLNKGNISIILYSNPNNPTWFCFTPDELKIIGQLAEKYDALVVEDLAYFGMDFRQDFSVPGQPPYQPTVAKYTDNYILLVSSSKVFSYAGQRIAMLIISDKLCAANYKGLARYYPTENFGRSLMAGTILTTTAGVGHSAQCGLAALFKAVNNGTLSFSDHIRVYEEKAVIIKDIFKQMGFEILYAMDLGKPIGDGFYFTVSYPGMEGSALIKELLYCGISAMSLVATGSERTEGLRICISLVTSSQYSQLSERLKMFQNRK